MSNTVQFGSERFSLDPNKANEFRSSEFTHPLDDLRAEMKYYKIAGGYMVRVSYAQETEPLGIRVKKTEYTRGITARVLVPFMLEPQIVIEGGSMKKAHRELIIEWATATLDDALLEEAYSPTSPTSLSPAFGEERFGRAEIAREGIGYLHDKVFSHLKSQGAYNEDDIESDLSMAEFYYYDAMDGVSMTGFAGDAEDNTIDEDSFLGDRRGFTPVEVITYLTYKKVLADGKDEGEWEGPAFQEIANMAGDADETEWAYPIDSAFDKLTAEEIQKLTEIYSDEEENRAFINRERIFTQWQLRGYSPDAVSYMTFQQPV